MTNGLRRRKGCAALGDLTKPSSAAKPLSDQATEQVTGVTYAGRSTTPSIAADKPNAPTFAASASAPATPLVAAPPVGEAAVMSGRTAPPAGGK